MKRCGCASVWPLRRDVTPNRRRHLRTALFVTLLGLGVYLLFGASDQRRVLGVLRELALAMSSQPGDTDVSRQRRVQSALDRLATADVVLEAPELGRLTGGSAIMGLFQRADGVPLHLSIDQSSVHAEGDRAQATLLVTLSMKLMDEERREIRTVTAELTRRASGFLIRALRVSARSRAEPEARP